MSSSGQKSSVAQTCNLLSQFFKDNGRFVTKLEDNKGVETSRQKQATAKNLLPDLENSAEVSRQNVKANDFFANIPTFAPSSLKDDAILEHGTCQMMTIFYAGKVFVFNDFSAEKAKEIMGLATKAGSNFTSELNMTPTYGNNKIATPVQFQRASLQRFFEKRKDRAAARSPYQVKSSPKPEDQSKYPGLEVEGQSSKQFDLNL